MPAAVMVPTVALPPAIPFTLQTTLVSLVFVTVAVGVIWFPSKMEPAGTATVTVMEGGGGSGDGATKPAPLQPSVHAPAARRAREIAPVVLKFFAVLRGRGRMPCAKQAKGQRKNCPVRVAIRIPCQFVLWPEGV